MVQFNCKNVINAIKKQKRRKNIGVKTKARAAGAAVDHRARGNKICQMVSKTTW